MANTDKFLDLEQLAYFKSKLGAAAVKNVDSTPTASSTNLVESGGVATALAGKQATLVVGTNLDNVPTSGSTNPITSGAVYTVVGDINTVLEEVL